MALETVDNLLETMNDEMQPDEDPSADSDANINIFSNPSIPMSTYIQIWSYLMESAPFPDGLVLTCSFFRDITYQHPILTNTSHVRMDPSFKLHRSNTTGFQIGITVHTLNVNDDNESTNKLSVIVLQDPTKITEECPLPFHLFRVFHLSAACSPSIAIPFLCRYHDAIRCMSWDINKWSPSSDDQKEKEEEEQDLQIPVFKQCQFLSVTTESAWNDALKINDKFPSLKWFNFAVGDSLKKWDEALFDKLQSFILSKEETLSVFVLDLSLRKHSKNTKQYNKDTPFTLVLPSNLEILVINCLERDRAEMMRFDFSRCRDKIKQIVIIKNGLSYIKPMLMDGKGAKNLEFLVIDDRMDVNEMRSHLLVDHPDLFKGTKVDRIYTPMIPKLSYSNPELQKQYAIECVDDYPDLEAVKDKVESHELRKMFRYFNCAERRQWLFCLFWYETEVTEGKGLWNLRQLERRWAQEDDL